MPMSGYCSTADQVPGIVCLFGRDLTGPARAQPPRGGEAVRELQLPGQGRVDEMPDVAFGVWLGREQDPHPQLAAGFLRAAPVRRQRARRLVLPVPAQRHCGRRPGSPHVGARLHDQARLMSKGLTHEESMRTTARPRTHLLPIGLTKACRLSASECLEVAAGWGWECAANWSAKGLDLGLALLLIL